MAIPVYLELFDDQGCKIDGGCKISDRIGMIEILAYDHQINLPTDPHSGQITGTRRHEAVRMLKQIDKSSPYLAKACCRGQTFKKAVLNHYDINDSGRERPFYRIELEDVKITGFGPSMFNVKMVDKMPHLESISIRYSKIKWVHIDGGIEYTDSWNDGKN